MTWAVIVWLLMPGSHQSEALTIPCTNHQCVLETIKQAGRIPYVFETKVYRPGEYAPFPFPDAYHAPIDTFRKA